MKKNWLKDKLKERFDDFDSGLDLEQAWNDLDQRRNPQKKNRRFIIFWMGLGLLGLAFLWTYSMNQTNENSDVEIQHSEAVALSGNSSLQDKDFSVQDINATNTKVKEEANMEDKSMKSNTDENDIKNEENNTKEKGSGPMAFTDSTLDIERKNKTSFLFEQNSIEGEYSEPFLNRAHIDPVKNAENGSDSRIEAISLLPGLLSPEIMTDVRPPIAMEVNPLRAPMDQIRVVKNSRSKFGGAIAYGWHDRQLDIVGDNQSDLVNAKKRQENALDAIAVNLFYRKFFTGDYFVEMGLGYQQTMYEFQDQEIKETYLEIDDQITAIHHYPDGSQETIRGTILQKETRVRYHTYYQSFRQVHLNAMIGKEWGIGNTFGLGISGGLEYGLFAQAKGVSFSDSEDFQVYSDLSELSYKKHGLLSGLLRIELLAALNARNEVGLALLGKSSLNNLFSSNGIIEKRRYLMSQISYSHRF